MDGRKIIEAKASATAVSVAMAYTRMLSSRYYFLDQSAEVALAMHLWSVGRQSLGMLTWLLSGGVSMAPYSWQETFFKSILRMPAYDSIIFYRKEMIRNRIKAAIACGVKHIVFLGGGFDVRPLLTSRQDVAVYELDRGATRAAKIKALSSLPIGSGFEDLFTFEDERVFCLGDNFKLINCDLDTLSADDLNQLLEDYGFCQHEQSLFIAEGLTTYLDEDANKKLLSKIAPLLTPESELLISYKSGKRELGYVETEVLKESEEKYQFAMDPEGVIPFLSKFDLNVCEKFDATRYLQAGGDPSADYYANNPQAAREHYYSLRRYVGIAHKNIADVPNMEFNIVPGVEHTYCNVL